ncbi:MAG: heparinase II/III family protein [Thermoguttaceae bacterium]|jgi:hypothetical protein|nr:heparinase II/III family protein [Thermoguttaceae bacterium]
MNVKNHIVAQLHNDSKSELVEVANHVAYRVYLVWLGIAVVLAGGTPAFAQPRTLYKPGDVENARRNIEQYKWAQSIVRGWERSVVVAMEQDRKFFEGLIPELTPGSYYGQNCPACVGKQSVMGESNVFHWSITKPDQIKCRRCGTVYPNEQYPETGVLECPRMGQVFTYYQTPGERENPDKAAEHALRWLGTRPTMTSFSGMIRYARVKWAYGQVLILAKLYAITDDIAYAERAAWILDRFARVYPNYLYHSYDGSYADWPPSDVAANMGEQEAVGGPRGGRFAKDVIRHAYGLNRRDDYSTLYNGFWGAGRLSVHGKGSDAGPLLNLTVAYDLIRDAKYPDGRPLLADDTSRRIRDDLILAGCTDMEHWDAVSNKGVATLSLSAAVGVLLEQPERVRRALDGFHRMFNERYHFDGFYSESPGYAVHNFSNLRELPDIVHGYSDPPGYQPESGGRLDDVNLFAAGRVRLALESLVRMLAPRNRLPAIGDTAYGSRLSVLYADILAARAGGRYAGLLETLQGAEVAIKGNEYALWYRPAGLRAPEAPVKLPLRSEWFPGWHVGVLRGGREENDTALYLNGNEHRWTLRTGHRQCDVLSFSIYAFGEELASDRGYFSGSGQLTRDGRSGQRWVRSSLSHNLVIVDEKDQVARQSGSNLELFGVAPGVEVVQASGVNVYPQCEAYRRTCVLVKTPGGQNYLVDFFRVAGGRVHQYSFHCNGSLMAVTPAMPEPEPVELSPAWSTWLSGTRAVLPEESGEESRTFTWRFRETKLELWLLNDRRSIDRIVIADAPGWRKGSPASELAKPPIQQILAENRADDDNAILGTQYAAVIVPYQDEVSPVRSARLLENDPETGVIAIEVRLAERTDYIISTRDQQQREFGPVVAAGQFALVSVDREGRTVNGYLLAGTRLACGRLDINLPAPSTTVGVRSVSGRTFHLSEPLPVDLATPGSYLLSSGPAPLSEDAPRPQTGFEIESATADAITVREYPPVECDEVTLLHSKWQALPPGGGR